MELPLVHVIARRLVQPSSPVGQLGLLTWARAPRAYYWCPVPILSIVLKGAQYRPPVNTL